MPLQFASVRSATAWFCLGYLGASSNLFGGDGVLPRWNAGNGRMLDEETEPGDELASEEYLSHEEEEEEEEESEEFVETTSVVCTILVLIALTIAFEKTKEHIEERVDRAMKPVITSLFGEMTVLGFLSVVTFCVTKLGYFTALSIRIFGEEEEEGLLEIFETVHFCLFFVMVFFVIEVIVLVTKAMRLEEKWLKMDRECQDAEHMTKSRALASEKKDRNARELILYYSLRDEFIKNRSVEPPFSPADGSDCIPEDFDYGRYLAICLGNTLAHSVEVDVVTWAFFALLAVVLYVIWLCAGLDMAVLAWVWLALGYLELIYDFVFERYINRIRNTFAPGSPQQDSRPGEQALLVEEGNDALPSWCKIDIDAYMAHRPWLAKKLSHKVPNRQDTLFFLEKLGPKVHLLAFQINLIFIAAYGALLILIFIPEMHQNHTGVFVAYVVFSVIPFLVKVLGVTQRMAIMSEVCCIGSLRKPQAIATVIREEKTERFIRTFIIICKLNRAAESGFHKRNHQEGASHTELFDRVAAGDIGKTFDLLDHGGDGYISTDDMGTLMEKSGFPLTQEKIEQMTSALDVDGDGKVSKEEFVQWYADQIQGDDSMTERELAHHIFNMFDHDCSGQVTIGEFKATLEAFNFKLSIDEIGGLVMELDEDGTGMIGLEEFEELFEKHYPKELHDLHKR